MKGKVEYHDNSLAKGWAGPGLSSDEPVLIDVWVEGKFEDQITANLYRGDLFEEHSPLHSLGFVYQIPSKYRDGGAYPFHFRFANTTVELDNSPFWVTTLDDHRLMPFGITDLSNNKVLVLAPHPDDESLACGGSLALHTRAGDEVLVVFLTDGARANIDPDSSNDAYVRNREREAREACRLLGISDYEFWRLPDRGLAETDETRQRLTGLLESFKPTLIYAPSPFEVHSDHRAVANLLWSTVRATNYEVKVAFYESNRPVNINTLVDITSVIDQKTAACQTYSSQLKNHPYVDCILGLNRYRALTVSPKCVYAEGFSLVDSQEIVRNQPHMFALKQFLRERNQEYDKPLVSVVIRTRDRLPLLRQALTSVIMQQYPNIEAIVVNDGGEDVSEVLEEFNSLLPIGHVRRDRCLGRSAAANAGVELATGKYINFLDDDDILYPDHVQKLVKYLETSGAQVAYSDCAICFYNWDGDDFIPSQDREVFCGMDFDREDLFVNNYVPIMTAMFSRNLWERVGQFDEALEFLEDWDFWIRAAAHADFIRIPGVTAEYRVFSRHAWEKRGQHQRQAKETIYEKHSYYWTPERLNEVSRRENELARESMENPKLAETLQALQKTQNQMAAYQAELCETKQRLTQTTETLAHTRETLAQVSRPSVKSLAVLSSLWFIKWFRKFVQHVPSPRARRFPETVLSRVESNLPRFPQTD